MSTSPWRDGHVIDRCGRGQWQIQCQIRGFRGIRGDQTPNEFSNLLIRFVVPPGSNPSLSAIKITADQ